MKYFLRIFSYIFHPLFMPLLGSLLYFELTPKFIPPSFLYAKLMAITILTVVVPILFYFMLRNLGKIDSIFIDDIKQRRIPLFFQVILTGIILFMVIRGYEFPELYSFFLAILISASMAFLASLTNIKISLHMVGVAGVLSFALALSIYYNSNLLMLLSLLFFIMGTVASSRLDQGAHDIKEIIMGVIVGCLPQLAIFFYIL